MTTKKEKVEKTDMSEFEDLVKDNQIEEVGPEQENGGIPEPIPDINEQEIVDAEKANIEKEQSERSVFDAYNEVLADLTIAHVRIEELEAEKVQLKKELEELENKNKELQNNISVKKENPLYTNHH